MNATSEPCAPGRGISSISRTPLRLEPRQRRRDVVHAQRDVVQARAPLLEISSQSASPRRRLEQLQRRFPGRDEVRPHPLRRDVLGRLDLEAERVAIEREGLVQVRDGDADVIERR